MGDVGRPRQRKFAPRSRQGCLTCRARRKRCDGQRPDCQNCTRLNMSCEWEAQRKIVTNTQAATVSTALEMAVSPPTVSLDPWDALPANELAERKHLLRYYVEAFIPSVSVADTPHSFYTSLYIPWAFECDGVLNAIMALSSAQLARRTESSDRADHLKVVSSKYQRKCYAFLADRVPQGSGPPRDAFQVIGIVLLLVGLEALNGEKSTRWLSQMKCVRDILNMLSAQINGPDPWEIDSLRRHFTYHNAMAALMARVSNRQSENFAANNMLDVTTSAETLTVDPLMGIAYYICRLISRIQYVTSTNPAFPHITEAAFTILENEIQQWTYGSPMNIPGLDLPVALDLIALAETYRNAALIQLYRTSTSHKFLIPACASRAMQFITRIPSGSPAESSMLFPIFMAGAELENELEISQCFKRLKEIQARNRYDNVGMVQKVLEEVWRPALNGQKKRDWEEVLREWGWSFTLG
ncbi:putative Zn(II)2Cys6 transcription factor-like protein [Periconia macrospinosa]|uniref:Putative Zn(II)2Cys6 transcription factor-like protein n=1 Tax=Periconia macrospinosa TaxID=97972 RepID=A0A2V1E4W8_9PLEO|nr:putative Zn(II)2Cys6 transcription factor-like protein [Periconia macrospinosa]